MDGRPRLGRAGEDAAAELYRGQGFEVLERNFRCRTGELDLVVRKPGLIVFCEVKTRSSDRFGLPAEAVGFAKQRRLRRLAAIWMGERSPARARLRFDVVSIVAGRAGLEVTHIPDAF